MGILSRVKKQGSRVQGLVDLEGKKSRRQKYKSMNMFQECCGQGQKYIYD